MAHTTLKTIAILSASALALAIPAAAQDVVPDDLTSIAPVPTDFDPPRTSWGVPDFRGTFPIDNIASIPMQRPAQFGDRFYLNDSEYEQRLQQAAGSDERYAAEDEAGTIGFGHWVESDASGRRTSLLVYPEDGQLPEMTASAQERYQAGRSSWTPNTRFQVGQRFRHLGSLHHARLPGFHVPLPLQQRHPRDAGSGLLHHLAGDDPRCPRHPGRRQQGGGRCDALARGCTHLDGPVHRLVGRQHHGDRDHQHPGWRQRIAGQLRTRPQPAEHGDDGRAAVQHHPHQPSGERVWSA